MPSPAMAPYHLSEHAALPLLAPVEAQLREIEARLGHYADRVRMSEQTRATVVRARDAVATARGAVGSIVADSRPTQ